MSEVKYFLNGKNFKDYGVYVSDSPGLFNGLAIKEPASYDWAEYHGTSVDLSVMRYKSREFELQCFIKGEDWLDMHDKFKQLISDEFSKPGTQRLVIDAFGLQKLAYEVYNKSEIELKKKFREGEMFGVFSIKLIEPNPVKKVLITQNDLVNLSFKSDSEFEIYWGDGTRTVTYGNFNEVKDYQYPSYNIVGYSMIQKSFINADYYQLSSTSSTASYYQFSVEVEVDDEAKMRLYIVGKKGSLYELVGSGLIIKMSPSGTLKIVTNLKISDYKKFIFKILDENGDEIPDLVTSNPQIKKAEIYGVWNNMTEKEKLIIIAGNIEEITDLTTNATILWNRL